MLAKKLRIAALKAANRSRRVYIADGVSRDKEHSVWGRKPKAVSFKK